MRGDTVGLRAYPPPRNRPDVSTSAQARVGGKHGGDRPERRSGGELGAALTTPARDDRPTGARPHPQPEPVRLRATTIVGLEGALTHRDSGRSSSPQGTKRHHRAGWRAPRGSECTGKTHRRDYLRYGAGASRVKRGSVPAHHEHDAQARYQPVRTNLSRHADIVCAPSEICGQPWTHTAESC